MRGVCAEETAPRLDGAHCRVVTRGIRRSKEAEAYFDGGWKAWGWWKTRMEVRGLQAIGELSAWRRRRTYFARRMKRKVDGYGFVNRYFACDLCSRLLRRRQNGNEMNIWAT